MKYSNMVLVIGPTRVGKGALVQDLVRELNEPVLDIHDQLRAVVVTAPTAQGRAFNMGDLWKDTQVAMGEPLVNRKVDLDAEHLRLRGENRPKPTPLSAQRKVGSRSKEGGVQCGD